MGALTEDLVNVLDNAKPLLNTLDLDPSPEQDTIQELSGTVTICLSAHQARAMVHGPQQQDSTCADTHAP